MAGSFSAPINVMGNVLEDLQHDPRTAKLMFGVGLAADAMKNIPPDIMSPIPHYEFEVDAKNKTM